MGWVKCPKAKQTGIYERQSGARTEYGFLRPRGNVEYAGLTLQEALDRRAQALLDASAGRQAPNTSLRIRDLAEDVRATKRERLRPASFEMLERGIDKFILPEFGHLKPSRISPEDITRLIRKMERRGLSGESITRYLSPLGTIFKLAIRRGCIQTSPMELLTSDERPKRTEHEHYEWTKADLEALLRAARHEDALDGRQQTYYPLIALLTLTGMRVSEALALRWRDIDLLGGVLRVSGSLSRSGTVSETKTRAGMRKVPLSEALVKILLDAKPENAEDEDWVFRALRRNVPMSYQSFRSIGWKRVLKTAGLEGKGITIHSLRHALASNLISLGISDVDVAAMLGHASPNTTRQIYAHVFDRVDSHERIRAALEGIG